MMSESQKLQKAKQVVDQTKFAERERRAAVFLDRDGTINMDKDFVCRIEDFEFLPGAIEGLKLLQDAGYLLIIITNQSGIARGYYTEADFHKLNDWMLTELQEHYGVKIDAVYYCPHLPSTDELVAPELKKYRVSCTCRKPQIGLFEKATITIIIIEFPFFFSIIIFSLEY